MDVHKGGYRDGIGHESCCSGDGEGSERSRDGVDEAPRGGGGDGGKSGAQLRG